MQIHLDTNQASNSGEDANKHGTLQHMASQLAEADRVHPWALLAGYNFGDDPDEVPEWFAGLA